MISSPLAPGDNLINLPIAVWKVVNGYTYFVPIFNVPVHENFLVLHLISLPRCG